MRCCFSVALTGIFIRGAVCASSMPRVSSCSMTRCPLTCSKGRGLHLVPWWAVRSLRWCQISPWTWEISLWSWMMAPGSSARMTPIGSHGISGAMAMTGDVDCALTVGGGCAAHVGPGTGEGSGGPVLFGGRLEPLTFSIGFLCAPPEKVAKALKRYFFGGVTLWGRAVRLRGSLEENLLELRRSPSGRSRRSCLPRRLWTGGRPCSRGMPSVKASLNSSRMLLVGCWGCVGILSPASLLLPGLTVLWGRGSSVCSARRQDWGRCVLSG